MNSVTDSSDSFDFEDIRNTVKALRDAPIGEPLYLMAPNEAVAAEWRVMFPGVIIWLDGKIFA